MYQFKGSRYWLALNGFIANWGRTTNMALRLRLELGVYGIDFTEVRHAAGF